MTGAVSYVLTVYNKAKFLPRVLAAVAAEHAATGGEIVIIDDGSTDDSPSLLQAFAARNAAVRLVGQANQGVAAATNAGLALAACPYIRLIDGDDVVIPGSTAQLRAALEKTAAGFAFGQQVVGANQKVPDLIPDACHLISDPLRLMLTNQPFIPSVTLGRREAMQACLALPAEFQTAQDFALGLALAAQTGFVSLAVPCCESPAQAGLSSSKARMFQDTAGLCLHYAGKQHWPLAYRNLALRRNAGRARNYLRRHLPDQKQAIRLVSRLAILARLPFPWPFGRWMGYIAASYQPAVADYKNHA